MRGGSLNAQAAEGEGDPAADVVGLNGGSSIFSAQSDFGISSPQSSAAVERAGLNGVGLHRGVESVHLREERFRIDAFQLSCQFIEAVGPHFRDLLDPIVLA